MSVCAYMCVCVNMSVCVHLCACVRLYDVYLGGVHVRVCRNKLLWQSQFNHLDLTVAKP